MSEGGEQRRRRESEGRALRKSPASLGPWEDTWREGSDGGGLACAPFCEVGGLEPDSLSEDCIGGLV